jgi:hypothetical protein
MLVPVLDDFQMLGLDQLRLCCSMFDPSNILLRESRTN